MGKHLRKGAETRRARSTAEGPSQQGSTTLMVQNNFTDSTEAWNVEILTTAACWKRRRHRPSPSRETRAAGPGFACLHPVPEAPPAAHLGPSVVDQLHRPPALVLDPHEYSAICVARGQLLVRLVPPHQHDLGDDQEDIY